MANSVRRELSQPLSPARKGRLRKTIATSLRQIDRIVATHGVTIQHLPDPTRRAYRFLASVDLDSIPSQRAAESDRPAQGDVTLVGLKRCLDGVVAQLAEPIPAERAHEVYHSIQSTSRNIDASLPANRVLAEDLTAQSRSNRGWIRFFSERENFDAYVAAVGRAHPAFKSAIQAGGRFSTTTAIVFRPTYALYRVHGYRDATRVVLPPAMICFTSELFEALAKAAINRGPKQALVEAASNEEYQGIQAELEALGGVEERTGGVFRDLEASFHRVAAIYFGGDAVRPRLTWSRSFTGRKFGHYDPVRDTVMISASLDRADVPVFVLDSVMHHELLHKKLGVSWHHGRMSAHPPGFREQERRFARFPEAELILRRLASEM